MVPKFQHKTARSERISKINLCEIFSKPGLYPVISNGFTRNRPPTLILQELADAGADLVQLRLKDIPSKKILKIADEFSSICKRYNIALIINDRPDIALACGADGVHLGQDDFPPDRVAKFANELFIGVSTHSLEEALTAEKKFASYINIGPILNTNTKRVSHPPLGLNIITEITKKIKIPFTVMGGIKSIHIPQLLELGAKRIAMVTEICEAENVKNKFIELKKLFQ